jgi:group I intron endonuclease
MVKKRKRRSDRMHLIYVLTNQVTGEKYVGMAVCVDRSGKETLAARWCRHVGRAKLQNKSWKLCESIRKYGAEAFTQEILEFVRGKAEAHERETMLRKTGQFKLNTV